MSHGADQMRCIVFSAILASVVTATASAQNAPADLVSVQTIQHLPEAHQSELALAVGRSEPVFSNVSFNKVAVSDDEVVEVTPMSDRQLLIRGKSVGRTNVIVYEDGTLVKMINVEVTQDLDSIEADLKALFPEHEFKLRRVAEKIYIEGEIEDTTIEERVINVVESYAPDKVINALTVKSPRQVALKVRFLEASRDDIKQLGLGNFIARAGDFAFSSPAALVSGLAPNTNGIIYGGSDRTTLDVLIQALEEKGTIRTLAEPNLVATSGQPASFLAGGEFPVPIAAEDNRITIEFREFGVSLDFEPEVLSKDRVNLKVKPEVSQVDQRNSIRLSGFEIPSLIVRKADTNVELTSGQTFAIAGLLQNSYDNNVVQTPFIGDVPIIGSLFRSTRFRERETELIILVTPVLINAAEQISAEKEVLPDVQKPSEAELFLLGDVSRNLQQYSAE
tara:strand:+ start:3818 stop:5164 length:1347 start_codon:yes stop_codon:yes gene_type:complete